MSLSGQPSASDQALKCLFWPRAGKDTLWNDYTLQRFVPFNPTDKYTIAHVKNNKTGECTRIMKGAPQVRGVGLRDLGVKPLLAGEE